MKTNKPPESYSRDEYKAQHSKPMPLDAAPRPVHVLYDLSGLAIEPLSADEVLLLSDDLGAFTFPRRLVNRAKAMANSFLAKAIVFTSPTGGKYYATVADFDRILAALDKFSTRFKPGDVVSLNSSPRFKYTLLWKNTDDTWVYLSHQLGRVYKDSKFTPDRYTKVNPPTPDVITVSGWKVGDIIKHGYLEEYHMLIERDNPGFAPSTREEWWKAVKTDSQGNPEPSTEPRRCLFYNDYDRLYMRQS